MHTHCTEGSNSLLTIHVRNLSVFAAQNLQIIRDISFSAKGGSITAVIGESGAGKSLTMKALSGLAGDGDGLRSDGELEIRRAAPGEELARPAEPRFAMIFQDPKRYLNPSLRVGAHLKEILRYASPKVGYDSAERLLELVQLPTDEGFLKKFPHELSGGMQQRLVIACAVASNPDILIADEALTALDVQTSAAVMKLFRTIADELGTAVFYISHDMKTVRDLADRVLVLYAGYLVEDRPAEEFFALQQHPYSRDLMEAQPALGKRGQSLREIPGVIPAAGAVFSGCPYVSRCSRAIAACATALPEMARGVRCINVEVENER